MKKIKYISFVLLLFVLNLSAGEAGKNGLPFLYIDVDARAAGMAGAYTAIASDVSAAYWNPAGLAKANNNSLIIMHNQWLADISQQYAAVQFMNGSHNMALSLNLMTIPGIEIRNDQPSENPDGVTDAFNLSAALSYARTFKNTWHVGINLKYLFEKYYQVSASGWAIDFGLSKQIFEDLDLGFTLQNMGAMGKLKNESTPLPLMARLGLSYSIPFHIFENKPLIAAGLQYISREGVLLRLGTELNIVKYIAVRLGVITGQNQTQVTTGLGVYFGDYNFDYALVPFTNDLGITHRFSFGMQF